MKLWQSIPIKSHLAQSRKGAKFFKNLEIPVFSGPGHKAQMNPPNLIFLCVFAPLREAIFIPSQLKQLMILPFQSTQSN